MELITSIVLCIVVLFLIDLILKSKLKIPIPKRRPIIGNVLSIGNRPHLTFTAWSKEYGNIYTFQAFKENYVIINGYNAVRQVLYEHGKVMAGRYRFYRAALILGGDKSDIILQDYSSKWKQLKNFAHSKVKQYGEGMSRIEDIAISVSDDLVTSLLNDSKENICDPHDFIYLAVVNSISSILTGKKYTANDETLKSWIRIESTAMEYCSISQGLLLDMFPWLRYFGNITYKKLIMLVKELDKVYYTIKDDYNKQNSGEKVKLEGLAYTLLEEVSKQELDNESSFINDHLAKNVLLDMLIAGTATTTCSLYAFLMIMAQHIEIQERISKEIQIVLSKKGSYMEALTLQDRDNMPYTRACLLELQRYGAFVPLGVVHKALENTSIDGVEIPKGSVIMTNLWSVLHDEEFWQKPSEFMPERFLDDSGNLVPSDHENRKRMISFGIGPRVCLGQSLANARMFIFATGMLRKLKVEKLAGETPSYDSKEYVFGPACKPTSCKLKFTHKN